MIRIRNREEAVMEALKSIVILDQNGKEHAVPVVYADNYKAEAMILHKNEEGLLEGDTKRIRLPLVALNATRVSRTAICFDGVIYAMFRQDLNQIIEALFRIEEDDGTISIGSVEIEETSVKGHLRVSKGKFILAAGN